MIHLGKARFGRGAYDTLVRDYGYDGESEPQMVLNLDAAGLAKVRADERLACSIISVKGDFAKKGSPKEKVAKKAPAEEAAPDEPKGPQEE